MPQNPKLREIINFFSYSEFKACNNTYTPTAMMPNATTNLVFVLDSAININNSNADQLISTCCISTIYLTPQIESSFITVQFNHYGMYYLTGIPVQRLQNSLLPLNSFFKASDLERITNQLKEHKSILEKFSALESFMIEHIKTVNVDSRLPYAITLLKRNPNLTMDNLSKTLCISNRGMQKLFNKHIGLSPSYLKKIIRFNRATELMVEKPQISLTAVALHCGYYDQAHFIKDFKRFGAITPSDFQRLQTKSSFSYNFKSGEADNLVLS
jgi:AraC-like DNA-binding protein